MPDASDAEILAAVRYGGAREVREIEQAKRHLTAQGELSEEDDSEAYPGSPVELYVAAAALVEQHIADVSQFG